MTVDSLTSNNTQSSIDVPVFLLSQFKTIINNPIDFNTSLIMDVRAQIEINYSEQWV